VGEKPFYDLLICDRTMRIEEIMVEDEIFEWNSSRSSGEK
jgi:hypothetical protein